MTETIALMLLAMKRAASAAPIAIALKSMQRSDGLWPAFDATAEGCPYATALATYALLSADEGGTASAAGLQAVITAYPREASIFWRWKFLIADRQVQFDPAKYGWGWVEGTISWVIPTAFAMLALRRAEVGGRASEKYRERLRSAEAMLVDRECRGGGWNAGNAIVFGVPLIPHIDATAIALLGLWGVRGPKTSAGLNWLVSQLPCASTYSLAWAMIALDAYRDVAPNAGDVLAVCAERLETGLRAKSEGSDLATTALAVIALGLGEHGNAFSMADL